jgi:hypothetical protein
MENEIKRKKITISFYGKIFKINIFIKTMAHPHQKISITQQFCVKSDKKIFKSSSITPQLLATISNSIDSNQFRNFNNKISPEFIYSNNEESIPRTLSLSNPPIKVQVPIHVIEASAETSPQLKNRSDIFQV